MCIRDDGNSMFQAKKVMFVMQIWALGGDWGEWGQG